MVDKYGTGFGGLLGLASFLVVKGGMGGPGDSVGSGSS